MRILHHDRVRMPAYRNERLARWRQDRKQLRTMASTHEKLTIALLQTLDSLDR